MKVIPRHTEEVILNVVQSQTSNIIMFHLLMKTVIFFRKFSRHEILLLNAFQPQSIIFKLKILSSEFSDGSRFQS
jgi:hypothetical protein